MVDRGSFSSDMSKLSFVDDRVLSYAPMVSETPLPDHWQPDAWSVICGRGKGCYDHFGNRRFRILIDMKLQKYKGTKSKIEKSVIVMSIVDTIREASPIGGFVKKDLGTQRWYVVADATAREKVGQQIRESLAKQNPNKCEARKIQRKTKSKRPRLSMSSAASISSSTVSLSSSEEFSSLSIDDAVDTNPLQVDFNTSTLPPPPPPSKGFDSPNGAAQSGKFFHQDLMCQLVPDLHRRQQQLQDPDRVWL